MSVYINTDIETVCVCVCVCVYVYVCTYVLLCFSVPAYASVFMHHIVVVGVCDFERGMHGTMSRSHFRARVCVCVCVCVC